MKTPQPTWLENFVDNQRLSDLFSRILVAGMLASLALAAGQLVGRVFPTWTLGFLPWLAFLVALEAVQATHYARENLFSTFSLPYWLLRVSEWIVFLIAVKLVLLIIGGSEVFAAELRAWQRDPLNIFAGGELWVSFLILLLVWVASADYAGDLYLMRTQATDVDWETRQDMEVSRLEARNRIVGRIFSLGIWVALLVALTRLDIRFVFGDLQPVQGPLYNLLIYLVCGLMLMGMTRFAVLRGRWLWEQAPISAALARRWFVISAVFFGLLVFIALLLPSNYALSIWDTLNLLVYFIKMGVEFLVFILIFLIGLISLPFLWLIEQLGGPPPTALPEETPVAPLPTPPPPALISPTTSWWDILASILFWMIFLVLVVLAVIAFIRQNETAMTWLTRLPLLAALQKFWDWFRQQVSGASQLARAGLSAGLARLRRSSGGDATGQSSGWFSLRRASPRQQIIFYYRALLRRAAELGLGRAPAATPHQFAEQLNPALPEPTIPEVTTLTAAFIEAEYSQHPIEAPQAQTAQTAWGRVRQALRSLVLTRSQTSPDQRRPEK